MSFRLACQALAALLAAAAVALPAQAQTLVRMQTTKGPIDIVLTDTATPLTVVNFLGYLRRNQYDGTFFHRLAQDFVLQGGGFRWSDAQSPKLSAVATQQPVANEFSAARPNVRGTVAMAKLGTDPNSATSQWFVNLKDNTTVLGEAQNGGFTVFGRVTTPSMAVVDLLSDPSRTDANPPVSIVRATGCGTVFGGNASALTDLPVYWPVVTPPVSRSCTDVSAATLAMVTTARELPARDTLQPADRVFNYLEAAFPSFVAPASPESGTAQGYYYRFYSQTNAYVGTRDGQVWYLGPATSGNLLNLGTLTDWLAVAAAAGY